RVHALNAAGKYEAGWNLLVPSLGQALLRLERLDILAEIMQTYFPQGWDQPPRVVTGEERWKGVLFDWAAAALRHSARTRVTRKLQEQVLRFELAEGYAGAVCQDLVDLTLTEMDSHPLIRESRLLLLATRLADAS